MKEHSFVRLAKIQKVQGTSYNGGLDIHPFGTLQKNMEIYGSVIPKITSSDFDLFQDKWIVYTTLVDFCYMEEEARAEYADLLAKIEMYVCRVITILVEKCGIYSFKPQSAFYEQFGFPGLCLLMRIRYFIKEIGKKNGVDTICMLDCKRGDIFTTQAAYFRGLLGNLQDEWGINYSPFDFDIINVTPWMGEDVMVLQDKGQPALGLKLMRQGKGIIGVSKSSNPSGPEYQEIVSQENHITVQMQHVFDSHWWSQEFDLECDGLSTIGLVVGSTHSCDGSIRAAFPGTTLLVPGFGAQGGDFPLIMLELIRVDNQWNGQGAIFSSSRGTMYAWMKKYGGGGKVANMEHDLIAAVANFRKNEKKAYEDSEVIKAGIGYPYDNCVI